MGLVRKIAEIRQKHESCHGTIPLSRHIRPGLSSSGHIKGFTIVELLIVIVVIAILAAISVVAYTGMQNNAHDTAVKSDLANFAKQIQMFHAVHAKYPEGGRHTTSPGTSTGNLANIEEGVSHRVTRTSYVEPTGSGAVNFTYCTGSLDSGDGNGFKVTALSKSGSMFQYSLGLGLQHIGGATGGVPGVKICEGIGYPRTQAHGFSVNRGGWQGWTG